jgi:flagella synthesis protein FlgN
MSVQAAEVRTHAGRILAEEHTLLQNLASLLQREAEIVRGDDAGAIERIGATRHDCIAALTRLEAERSASCRMLSFGEGRGAFQRLLDFCDANGDLRRRWQANLTLARRCKDLNDRNGAIVTVKLSHVQKLLRAMRGETAAPVYAPPAARQAGFATRVLGQA